MTDLDWAALLFWLLDRHPDDIDGERLAVLLFADLHRKETP